MWSWAARWRVGDVRVEDARFDRLVRSVASLTSRRGLLGLAASLPVAGAGLAFLDPDEAEAGKRHKNRKDRHRNQQHNRLDAEKKKKKKKKKKPQPPPTCTPNAKATTCAGKCGSVTNNCGQAVDCGSCACQPACDDCFTCDESTRTCKVDPGQEGKACGSTGQVCQQGGTCACDATSCPDCQTCGTDGICAGCAGCCDAGTCVETCPSCTTCSGGQCVSCPGCCDGSGACQDGTTNAVCGAAGATCAVCSGQNACVSGQCVCQPTTCAAGNSCGQIADGCGGILQCGGCSNPTPICTNHVCTACGSNDDCSAGQRCCAGSCLSNWSGQSTFGTAGGGAGQFAAPWGLAVSANRLTMWVTEYTNNRVSVWTRSSTGSAWTFQTTFGGFGAGNSQFSGPWGVAVSADTLRVWVADTGNSRVTIWARPNASSTAWTYQAKFGTAATGLGTFAYPSDMILSQDELTLWIADTARGFSVWTRPDAFSNFWSNPKMVSARGSGESDLMNPWGLAISADELTMWVADSANHRISVWTRPNANSTNWSHQTNFGSQGSGPDQFNQPSDVAVSNDSRTVWVTEYASNRVSVWTRPNANSEAWSPLTTFGESGNGLSQFHSPTELSISADNTTIWIVDENNNRVSTWTLTCPA